MRLVIEKQPLCVAAFLMRITCKLCDLQAIFSCHTSYQENHNADEIVNFGHYFGKLYDIVYGLIFGYGNSKAIYLDLSKNYYIKKLI